MRALKFVGMSVAIFATGTIVTFVIVFLTLMATAYFAAPEFMPAP